MISLRLPLKDIFVTQPFGVNYLDFYQQMGLPYHPGIDFRSRSGCYCFAVADGIVTRAGVYSDGGIGIEIDHGGGYTTFYYHLQKTLVEVGQKIEAGQIIALTDNTGKYTTGDHLHFELRCNGVKINPAPFFYKNYIGMDINPKDWDKSRCYHRYYRGRPKGGYQNEFRILSILGIKKIFPTAEKVNALVYGGWDLETVINPAMYEIWSQLKKDEYIEKGLRPFA